MAKPTNQKRISGITPYKLEDVIAALKVAVKQKRAVCFYSLRGDPLEEKPDGSCIQVTLEQIRDELAANGKLHSYVLRFSYLNPMAADRGKRTLETNAQNVMSIDEGEAGEVGSHLVIAPPDVSGPRAGLSKCALEQMTSLSRGKVVSLINDLAEQFMEPTARPRFEYIEGRGKKRKTLIESTRLNLLSKLEKSESLEDDLESGVITKLRFIGRPSKTDELPLDGLERIEQQISASVKSAYRSGNSARALIKAARKYAKEHNFRAKIEVEQERAGFEHKKTRELDLDKEGLAEQLFARQETITADLEGYPEIYGAINESVVQELRALIDREECWS